MMGRRSTFFLTIMAAFVGFGLFHIKYDVMRLEKEYRKLCQLQVQAEESIRILRAEWAHLNTPERLARLCAKHLPVQQPAHAAQLFSVRCSKLPGSKFVSFKMTERRPRSMRLGPQAGSTPLCK